MYFPLALSFWDSAKNVNLLAFFVWKKKKKNNFHCFAATDEQELHRQNRITAQIVANYLERKLFPFKRPTNQLPTIDDILPSIRAAQQTKQTKFSRHLTHRNAGDALKVKVPLIDDYNSDDYEQDPENLQSVESNHVDSYYEDLNDDNDNKGRFYLSSLTTLF